MSSQTILLVEDSEDDVFIFKRIAKKAQITNPVHVADDGEAATAYLAGTGPFADRAAFPLPFLVLLDLKLPRLGGFDILQWMREQPHLAHLSVVVLTSSAERCDVARAYELGARSYLVKPPTAAALRAVLDALSLSPAATHERLHIEGEQTP